MSKKEDWKCSECGRKAFICEYDPCKEFAKHGMNVCAGTEEDLECGPHNSCCRHSDSRNR